MTEQVQQAEPTTKDNEAHEAVEQSWVEVAIYSGPCDLRPDESE